MSQISKKLLRVFCVLGLVMPVVANDTIIMLPEGEDPNTATGDSTYTAVWNGMTYDSIHVVTWLRDLGDTSANEAWRGYQIAYDDAIPTPGCTGNVTKSVGTLSIDISRTDWLHYSYVGFQTLTDDPGLPGTAMGALMSCSGGCPGLGDEAKYLCEMTFDIANGSSGVWIVRPRCLYAEDCPGSLMCTKSYTSCLVDADCPRFTILGDETDTCVTGISPDADTFVQDDLYPGGRVPADVFQLEIVIPIGQCCDGIICLEVTEEDCDAVGGVWDSTKTCGGVADCPCLDNGDCEDGDMCTENVCDLGSGLCASSLNYDDATECCDSVTGVVTTIDDANECTMDVCNPDGSVTWTPVAWGTESAQCLTDAGENLIDNYCTLNICDGAGGCEVFAIDGSACDDPVYGGAPCLSPTYGTGGTCEGDTCSCIRLGQCCSGSTCLGDLTDADCDAAGGTWNPLKTCADQCAACVTDMDCVALDSAGGCAWDHCGGVTPGVCDDPIQSIYGDVCGTDFHLPPNGSVNLTDIICALNAFGLDNMINCPNADIAIRYASECPEGNGIVNLSDILAVLNAYGAPVNPTAIFLCDCPLNPGQ